MKGFSRSIAALCLLVVFGVAWPARGYSYFTLGGNPVTWYGQQAYRYLSPSSFPSGSPQEAAMISAMIAWSQVPACNFVYGFETLDQDYQIDNFDGFSDTAAVSADQLDPGVLGVTFLVNSGAEWFDADMVFSDFPLGVGYLFDLYPDCDELTQPAAGGHGYSFLLVALHEAGHAIGLGHDPAGDEAPGSFHFAATMNPRYPSGGTLGQEHIIELHSDDRAGARFLYPHSGPSGPAFVDLGLAGYGSSEVVGQVRPLPVSPPVSYPGEEVILRSLIENLGTTNQFYVRQGFYLSEDDWISTEDTFLGSLTWDIAFEDALDFEVAVTLPDDLPSGPYTLGAMIDDEGLVDEVYEDNNALAYCEPFSIAQLPPAVAPFDVLTAACTQPFVGPVPSVSHPLNMAPITWSLDNPMAGMEIDSATGVISWADPVPSVFPYGVHVRASNGAGSTVQTQLLGVYQASPEVLSIADATASCLYPYVGPVPQLSDPACMAPVLNWSFVEAPPGMTIDYASGQVQWGTPTPSAQPYRIEIRATNASGNGTTAWYLRVAPGDLSGDGAVGRDDWAAFQLCFSGPGSSSPGACACVDFDGDGRVDLSDVGSLFNQFEP